MDETLELDKYIRPPIDKHLLLLSNHVARYHAAIRDLNISRQDLVVDASCGNGYGSYIMAQKSRRVIGLDISKEYLKAAQTFFKQKNLEFVPYPDFFKAQKSKAPQVDKLVCIETFEHIKRPAGKKFLSKMIKHLRPRGSLFLTVPVGKNRASTYNQFHLFEPSIDYVFDMVKADFKDMNIRINEFKNSFGRTEKFALVSCLDRVI